MLRPTQFALVFIAVVACTSEPVETSDAGTDAKNDTAVLLSCAEAGGECISIGDCGPGAGLLVDGTCTNSGSANSLCCVDFGACSEAEYRCCEGDATFRSVCNPSTDTTSCLRGKHCEP